MDRSADEESIADAAGAHPDADRASSETGTGDAVVDSIQTTPTDEAASVTGAGARETTAASDGDDEASDAETDSSATSDARGDSTRRPSSQNVAQATDAERRPSRTEWEPPTRDGPANARTTGAGSDGLADAGPVRSEDQPRAADRPERSDDRHDGDGTRTAPTAGRQRDDDEKFCTACGEVIEAATEICPACGVRQADVAESRAKDPGVAAVLSAVTGGWAGQVYNGEIGKGMGLLLLQVVNLLLVIVLIGILTGTIVWLLGIYDAYNSAERINSRDREP